MINTYIYDFQNIYVGEEARDPYGPMPARSILAPPPQTSGTEVARWTGTGWEVLPERPTPPHVTLSYPQFTALEMLDLFTEDEQRAVKQAAMQDVDVGLWYDRLIAADYVTYADPRTEGGLQALVDAGLLDPGRKAEIVAAMQPETADT